MRRYLCILICLFSFKAFSAGTLTTLQTGLTIYSEFYPNSTEKFKGTIVFVNGSGTDLSEWKSSQTFFNCVKKLGSTFFYDRPGLGKSPPYLHLSLKNPLTSKLVSDQLSTLLKNLNIRPPYLFVAHSFGAMYAGYYTLKHSDTVKGLLLVDPVPRDFNFSTTLMHKYKKGIGEVKLKSVNYIYKKYSGSQAEVIYQLLGFNESKQSIKHSGDINNTIPVIIISSTGMEKEHPIKEDWYKTQKQWLNKNPMSKIIRVSSDHFIQLKKPQKVCEELKQILNESSS